jgi:hypothetical protein
MQTEPCDTAHSARMRTDEVAWAVLVGAGSG